jgi:hypothetical protein
MLTYELPLEYVACDKICPAMDKPRGINDKGTLPGVKPGEPLAVVPGFPTKLAAQLRDQLSVTTAEEFVDLAHRHSELLASALSINPQELEELLSRAAQAIPPEVRDEIMHADPLDHSFSTGHDPPPQGRDTFFPHRRLK